MIEAIEQNQKDIYIQKVAEYSKFTPFDKVKSTLMAKIKEIYIPEDAPKGAAFTGKELDLTGASESIEKKTVGGGGAQGGGLDFT